LPAEIQPFSVASRSSDMTKPAFISIVPKIAFCGLGNRRKEGSMNYSSNINSEKYKRRFDQRKSPQSDAVLTEDGKLYRNSSSSIPFLLNSQKSQWVPVHLRVICSS
jgi:hypothetical protein